MSQLVVYTMVLNSPCIAKPDLITFQRHCVIMQSVLASSLHVYLEFPQHPFVCSPHAQDSRLMECALSSPHETAAFICLFATTKKSNYRLPLLLSIFRFQVQFEYNITMHLILSHYAMILL